MEEIFRKINSFLNYKFEKRWQYITAAFLVIVLLFASALSAFEVFYYGRVFPGVSAAGMSLSGKMEDEVKRDLINVVLDLEKQEIIFEAAEKTVKLTPTEFKKINGEIINFDAEMAAKNILSVGRNKNIFLNLKERLFALILKKEIQLELEIDKILLQKFLEDNFAELEKPAVNAQLKISNGEVAGIIPEQTGKILDYDTALNQLVLSLSHLEKVGTIKLNFKEDYPSITREDAVRFVEPLSEILSLAPVTLKYEEKTWTMDKEFLISSLELQTKANKEEGVGLNKEKMFVFFAPLAVIIDREAQNAQFIMEDNRVKNFVPNLDGLKFDLEKNYNLINAELTEERKKEIGLLVETAEPAIKLSDLNNLGIKEKVGFGKTNFAGSPYNRRRNIARGAALLQWKLIKPDEEFSLLSALKPFTLENGYFSELVIKGNRTTPEVGGGLCQIGTTMFRVVLDAGLPVTARRNHSYRVSYYEPPIGMDATIYDPAPDFKFINDTGAHLLLFTLVRGDELIFELWGTDDGRLRATTDPVVYNFVSPPPEKIIETLDLKPGETKCTERAHTGSDAKFTYKVTYPNGEIKEEEFISHYVPWQKVCLLGVEKFTPAEEEVIDGNAETLTNGEEIPAEEL